MKNLIAMVMLSLFMFGCSSIEATSLTTNIDEETTQGVCFMFPETSLEHCQLLRHNALPFGDAVNGTADYVYFTEGQCMVCVHCEDQNCADPSVDNQGVVQHRVMSSAELQEAQQQQ